MCLSPPVAGGAGALQPPSRGGPRTTTVRCVWALTVASRFLASQRGCYSWAPWVQFPRGAGGREGPFVAGEVRTDDERRVPREGRGEMVGEGQDDLCVSMER